MSALPPKADIVRRQLDVCFVPKGDHLPLVTTGQPEVGCAWGFQSINADVPNSNA